MKSSTIGFAEGFLGVNAQVARSQGAAIKAFDWDQAAMKIKEAYAQHPDLVAEAGLEGDWAYTGGVIFESGLATNGHYTYLASNWAAPTLILSWDGVEKESIECSCPESDRFNSETKWDTESLTILGLPLNVTDEI